MNQGPGGADDNSAGAKSIGEAVSYLLLARGLSSAQVLAAVSDIWVEAAGAELARCSRPVLLRGLELVCEVTEPAVATKLRLASAQVLGRLDAALGGGVAERIVTVVRPPGRATARR
jgi:hypothetical protein